MLFWLTAQNTESMFMFVRCHKSFTWLGLYILLPVKMVCVVSVLELICQWQRLFTSHGHGKLHKKKNVIWSVFRSVCSLQKRYPDSSADCISVLLSRKCSRCCWLYLIIIKSGWSESLRVVAFWNTDRTSSKVSSLVPYSMPSPKFCTFDPSLSSSISIVLLSTRLERGRRNLGSKISMQGCYSVSYKNLSLCCGDITKCL